MLQIKDKNKEFIYTEPIWMGTKIDYKEQMETNRRNAIEELRDYLEAKKKGVKND